MVSVRSVTFDQNANIPPRTTAFTWSHFDLSPPPTSVSRRENKLNQTEQNKNTKKAKHI